MRNGEITQDDKELVRKGTLTEIDCYACTYDFDAYTFSVSRDVKPIKGVLKYDRYKGLVFYPLGKKGKPLSQGISYWGNNNTPSLALNTLEEESYKIYLEALTSAIEKADRLAKKIENRKNSILSLKEEASKLILEK
jgi:hypothetical protein